MTAKYHQTKGPQPEKPKRIYPSQPGMPLRLQTTQLLLYQDLHGQAGVFLQEKDRLLFIQSQLQIEQHYPCTNTLVLGYIYPDLR
jgi:hypothetical protein